MSCIQANSCHDSIGIYIKSVNVTRNIICIDALRERDREREREREREHIDFKPFTDPFRYLLILALFSKICMA